MRAKDWGRAAGWCEGSEDESVLNTRQLALYLPHFCLNNILSVINTTNFDMKLT